MGTSTAGVSSLPPLYAPWVEEVLGRPVPEERHATCSSCAMCPPTNAWAATASLTAFDPAIKCCTYVPTLPNFLVGMVLDDDEPAAAAGRESVERRIAKGVGVTPLGLQPDPHYALIYNHTNGELFGRSSGLRCPHFLPAGGGLCGIWRHRNAVCATYFCKYERGRIGKRFWEAIRQLLLLAERHLALWVAAELGERVEALGPSLLPYYATILPRPESTWSQRWAGEPQRFYRASAELVAPLSWTDVNRIGGPELSLLAGQLRAAFGALQAGDVPDYLRLAGGGSVVHKQGARALVGYSTLDLPIVEAPVASALESFDGHRPTSQVCAALGDGSPIDLGTIRRLVDFEVLAPVRHPESDR